MTQTNLLFGNQIGQKKLMKKNYKKNHRINYKIVSKIYPDFQKNNN
jgi:hypothetical protein